MAMLMATMPATEELHEAQIFNDMNQPEGEPAWLSLWRIDNLAETLPLGWTVRIS